MITDCGQFSDVTKLLNTYQLWLDDLFPKAKFADGLSIIEKLGHKKQMQMLRKEWIDEGKFKPPAREDEEVMDDIDDAGAAGALRQTSTNMSQPSRHDEQGIGSGHRDEVADVPDPAEPGTESTMPQQASEMDDLDALLAEEDSRTFQMHRSVQNHTHNHFEDDEAAMAELGL